MLGVLRTVLGPMLTLPVLLMGYGSVGMVTVTLSVSLITDILYLLYTTKRLKERFLFGSFESGLLKSLMGYSVFIALNIIIDQINWNIDKTLLGRFRGTAEVAVYSVGFSLYHYYMLISTSISGVFTPRIHRIYNEWKEQPEELDQRFTGLFIRVSRIQCLVLGLVASGVALFGQVFIHFWVGDGFENAYFVALLLIFPASIALIQSLGIEIQRAENKHHFRSIVYAFMALINLGLSIWLCQKYGAVGSAIGTSISLIVANGLLMNMYYYKKCGIDIPLFW
jgi:O-antigen/teichoic acid export membrane protein